jgi:hypothetical protein
VSLDVVAESSEDKASAGASVTSEQDPKSDGASLGLTVVFASNIDGEIEPCG